MRRRGPLTQRSRMARARILVRLHSGEASTSELAKVCGEALPSTLTHLEVMVQFGLVRRRRDGRTSIWSAVRALVLEEEGLSV